GGFRGLLPPLALQPRHHGGTGDRLQARHRGHLGHRLSEADAGGAAVPGTVVAAHRAVGHRPRPDRCTVAKATAFATDTDRAAGDLPAPFTKPSSAGGAPPSASAAA